MTDSPEPRIWKAPAVANLLGYKQVASLRARLPELYRAGFPAYDELLRGWDIDAVRQWLDKRSGVVSDPKAKNRAILREGLATFREAS